MAAPLLRRSYQALKSRPFGAAFGLRRISTGQQNCLQPLTWLSQAQSWQLTRRFASGGVSRSLLANIEAAANRNPRSATAQNAFYQLLLRANMPALVVERYNSGRYATNEAADEAFQTAQVMLNGTEPGRAGQPRSSVSRETNQAIAQAVAAYTKGGNAATTVAADGSNSIRVTVDEPLKTSVFRWVKLFLWLGLVYYFGLVIFTALMDGLGSLKRGGGRAPDSMEAKAENQKTTFADVHGCDEAKEELQDLVEFLRNPQKFNTLGGKLPKGVLLVGPPGTGKTLLARAVAGEAGVPFFYMSGSEFDEMFVGVGAKRVRDLFSAAKAKSPSIVFIDELDAVGARRNPRDSAYHKQTLNQLLTELDGFEQNSGVIVIGATNFPKSLDKALTRPGRFDRMINVFLPDVRGRIAILKHHAKKIKIDPNVNLEAIAGLTSGMSGAELENLINLAAIHASKSKAKMTTQSDLDYAKDKVIMGAERKSMFVPAKEKLMTAYHEAGHALVLVYADDIGQNLYKVTILPRGPTLGHTAPLAEMDKLSHRIRDLRGAIDVSMGGKAAEEVVYGPDYVTSGASADLNHATTRAYAMVAQRGMSEKMGNMDYGKYWDTMSSETKAKIEAEVQKLLDESYARTKELLLAKRKELDLLANALVEYETLDLEEVKKVIRGEKLVGRISVPKNAPMKIAKPVEPEFPGKKPEKPPPPRPEGGVAA